MTQNLFFHKKLLIQKVFEKAKVETKQSSFSGVLKDLEIILRDDYNIPLSYKTFENYYKAIVEENRDYKIRPETLDELSTYLNEEDFDSFCLKHPVAKKEGIDISVTENAEQVFTDSLHRVIINITNSPVFNLPEFISKHRNSLGIVGIIVVLGFYFNQNKKQLQIEKKFEEPIQNFFGSEPKSSEIRASYIEKPPIVIYNSKKEILSEPLENISVARQQECMYWSGDHYEPAFCDEIIPGKELIALNEEKLVTMRKITRTDTLRGENALEKVWYSKKNGEIEFFTAAGLHPESGKTLKPVTKYIIEKYIINR